MRRATRQEIRSAAWAGALMVVSAVTVLSLWMQGYRLPPIWAVLVLAAVAALAERQSVWVTERTTMSVSFLPLVFAAVVFGPLGGFAVGALSYIWDVRESRLRWCVYTPIRGLTAAFAGLMAWTLVPHASGFGQYLLASLVASVADLVSEAVLAGATAIVRGYDALAELRGGASLHLLTVPLYVPILTLFVYGYHAYSLRLVLVFFVPTLAAQRLLHLYQEEKEARRRLTTANARLRSVNVRFAARLVEMLEANDPYTANHSKWVATYSRDIGARMNLSEDQLNLVHVCALLHDIGKYRLPTALLQKPGALTLEERRQMEKHSEYGAELLREVEVEDYETLGRIVRHHHERMDGNGYPDGLQGTEIPLLSRIITVADSYQAMTSDRPYRDRLPSRVARLRLAQAVESQFDTSVVAAFEAVLTAADESYRSGAGEPSLPGWHSRSSDDAAPEYALAAATA
jgi:putative nucleotidyltransferase with HDIG domain